MCNILNQTLDDPSTLNNVIEYYEKEREKFNKKVEETEEKKFKFDKNYIKEVEMKEKIRGAIPKI